MAASHLEIVQGIYDAWARGDMGAGPAHFHPDIHFESFMPDSAERVVASGLDGIVAFMAEFLPAWRDYWRFDGDRVVSLIWESSLEGALRVARNA